ncbi:ubiquitin-conjugating enzyme E2 6 [Pholiota molesta]|nr:ubiquitin-conjugating enzyme E2 6 [Pholiota molesta]
MASKAAQKRLTKEYVAMQKEPPPFVWAAPDEKNILTWNFLIRGPPDSPFADGEYHGVLMFPPEYPFKPPGIKMFTPSGRFAPDKKICFSMSDFHPGSWNPAWSVATILTGLLSFMLSDEMTTGSVTSSDTYKRAFAARSHSWNITQPRFKEAFPEYSSPVMRDLPNMGEKERGKPDVPRPPLFSQPPASTSVNVPAFVPIVERPPPLAQDPVNPVLDPTDPLATRKPDDPTRAVTPPAPASTWTTWRSFIYEKWRLCAFIALAVMLSRFTTRG